MVGAQQGGTFFKVVWGAVLLLGLAGPALAQHEPVLAVGERCTGYGGEDCSGDCSGECRG